MNKKKVVPATKPTTEEWKKRHNRKNNDVAVKERYNQQSSNLSKVDVQSKKNVQAFWKIMKTQVSGL